MDVDALFSTCPICHAGFVTRAPEHTYCSKKCQQASYRKRNREKAKEEHAKYHRENKETLRKRYREWSYAAEYGITLEDYILMFEEQNGSCAICKQRKYSKHGLLSVDHDHETGIVRGLLCHRCNLLLGLAKDSSDLLLIAAEYLKDYGKRR